MKKATKIIAISLFILNAASLCKINAIIAPGGPNYRFKIDRTSIAAVGFVAKADRLDEVLANFSCGENEDVEGVKGTATLIGNSSILTTAHISIEAGDYFITCATDDNGNAQMKLAMITEIRRHPSFNPPSGGSCTDKLWGGYDLAVAKLEQPVSDITPLNFVWGSTPYPSQKMPVVGDRIFMVGYGYSGETFRPANFIHGVKYLGYNTVTRSNNNIFEVHDDMGAATRGADSGGPALIMATDFNGQLRWHVVGVVTGGCFSYQHPDGVNVSIWTTINYWKSAWVTYTLNSFNDLGGGRQRLR